LLLLSLLSSLTLPGFFSLSVTFFLPLSTYALFVSVVDSYSVCFSFRVGGFKQIVIHI
jgi:hypothetical protein